MTTHDVSQPSPKHVQPETLGGTSFPTRLPLATAPGIERRLEGSRAWFSSSITERGSGVKFMQKDDGVYAQLGRRETAIPKILPQMLTAHPPKGPLSADFERVFHDHVIPELIEPTRQDLLARVEAWNARSRTSQPPRLGVHDASVVQEEPLVVSIAGIQSVIMGRFIMPKPVHFFVEWSNCGSLRFIDISNGSQRTVPLGSVMEQPYLPLGILGAMFDKMR